jgi:hypothetical protein
MVDATVSKTVMGNHVRVRVPLPAPASSPPPVLANPKSRKGLRQSELRSGEGRLFYSDRIRERKLWMILGTD